VIRENISSLLGPKLKLNEKLAKDLGESMREERVLECGKKRKNAEIM
jgi:hypothetical protein